MEKLPFLLLAIIASVLPTGFAIRCYICSWSPDDANNKTDQCSDENFSHRDAQTVDCEKGCETYAQWDRNEALEQWRRNCYRGDAEVTGECVSEDNVALKFKRCSCDQDYCNSGTSLCVSCPLLQMIVLGISFLFINSLRTAAI